MSIFSYPSEVHTWFFSYPAGGPAMLDRVGNAAGPGGIPNDHSQQSSSAIVSNSSSSRNNHYTRIRDLWWKYCPCYLMPNNEEEEIDLLTNDWSLTASKIFCGYIVILFSLFFDNNVFSWCCRRRHVLKHSVIKMWQTWTILPKLRK